MTNWPAAAAALCLGLALTVSANADCTACHAAQTHQPHSNVASCSVCHGEDPAHPPSTAKILAFETETAAERSAVCSECHDERHAKPGVSAHARAGLACDDCHRIHSPPEAPEPVLTTEAAGSTACYGCHQEVFAQFEFNERHRLQEDILTCTSCHDPHEAVSRTNLGGFSDTGCRDCHAEMDGPFVFEHGASRAEGCVACHAPHGSPNRHMLTHQETGELCYSCHAIVPQFHLGFAPVGPARFGTDTVCTNCHVTIHGSNLDRLFLK